MSGEGRPHLKAQRPRSRGFKFVLWRPAAPRTAAPRAASSCAAVGSSLATTPSGSRGHGCSSKSMSGSTSAGVGAQQTLWGGVARREQGWA